MALLRGLVFEVNRRALFAVLAIAISVSYALVAGAAVTGLQDAQETLASDLQETDLVATMVGEPFGPTDLPHQPDVGLAVHRTDSGHVIVTSRIGPPVEPGNDTVMASPSSGFQDGQEVEIDGRTFTVTEDQLPKGASLGWLGVSPRTFEELGGRAPPTLHVAVYEDGSPALAEDLQDRGFETHRAPGALGFYTKGASELVSAVRVTVLASTVVVALLTSGFVALELHAKRQTLSTLQLYAGAGRVRALAAGRGLALLTGGHVLALGATMGLLAVIGRIGALSLSLDPGFAGLALAATFGGGLLGLIPPLRQAAQPLQAKDLADEEPPRWAPRWARPTLASWRILVPLLAAAIVLSASLGVVFGVVDLPGQLFGTGGSDVVADTSGNPLRGQVSTFLGLHLDEVEGFETASPEIFAPTEVDGRPVMVRGVDWASLTDLETIALEEGQAPQGPGEAVAGDRLANRLGLSPGDRLTLPGAYVSTVETVEIVGVAEAPGILDDELLVSLPMARALTGLPSDRVNLVRYIDTREVNPITGEKDPFPSGIEVTDLRLRPADPVPHEPAVVEADVINFGATSGSRTLTLRVNGQPAETATVQAPARDGATHTFGFRTPATGLRTIEVNPTLETQGGQPAYEIDAPKVATVNRTFQVTITDQDGRPAQGVEVRLEQDADTTDADGQARLTPRTAGNQTLVASGPDGRAAQPIFTPYPSDLHRHRLRFNAIEGPTQLIEGETWEGAVVVENIGGEPYRGPIPLRVNQTTMNVSNVRLQPGDIERASVDLDLPTGTHTIGPGGKALSLVVREQGSSTGRDTGQDDRSLEELLELRRERAQLRSNAEPEATQAFLGDTFENLNAALTVVSLATVLHAGLITLVAVHREVEQRSPTLGTMAAMGADRRDVRGLALREYLLIGTTAALVGTLIGLAVAWIGAELSLISGFGHALLPRVDPGFILRVAGASVLTTLGAAVLSVEAVHGRRPGELLTEGPSRTQRPPLDTLLEGRP